MGIFAYAVQHRSPKDLKTPILSSSMSGSCFGGLSGCFTNVPQENTIDRRMFFSTYYTKEEFNLFVRGMREYWAGGFNFKYGDKVRHFERPTIGYYDVDSTAKGFCQGFSNFVKKNCPATPVEGQDDRSPAYVSLTVPEGVTNDEAFVMIKHYAKILCSPNNYPTEIPTFVEAMRLTDNNWLVSMVAACCNYAGAGYQWPLGLTHSYLLLAKAEIHTYLNNRGGDLVFQLNDVGMKPFHTPLERGERNDRRIVSTRPSCMPSLNPTNIQRGSREVFDSVTFSKNRNNLTGVARVKFLVDSILDFTRGKFE